MMALVGWFVVLLACIICIVISLAIFALKSQLGGKLGIEFWLFFMGALVSGYLVYICSPFTLTFTG